MSSFSFPCSSGEYEKLCKIGAGSFSQVWSARLKQNNTTVALKIMDLENISSSFEDILQEVQTMRLAEDPNILHCFCSFVHSDQLWLVTELMDKGSCVRVMKLSRSTGLGEGMSEECAKYIIHEVLKGLIYLHNQGQIHRDVKAGNILLNSTGEVKLADFGVSGWTLARGERVNTVKTFVGTPCYMAPEVMEQASGYDYKADIWSLGITALELAKGYAPYALLPPMRVLIKTIEEDPPSLLSYPHPQQLRPDGPDFSEHFQDFCRKCLQKSPKSRPKAEELSRHVLFKQSNKEALLTQLLSRIPSVGAEVRVAEDIVDLQQILDHGAKISDNGSTTSPAAHAKPAQIDDISTLGVNNVSQVSHMAVVGPSESKNIEATNKSVTFSVTDSEPQLHREAGSSAAKAAYVPGTSWVFEADDNTVKDSDNSNKTASATQAEERQQAKASHTTEEGQLVSDFLEEFDVSM